MNDIHEILFNMISLYSFILGAWAAFVAASNRKIPGSYWGAIVVYTILVAVTLGVGVIMTLQGMHLESDRMVTYYLYMLFLLVIMPGLFSFLRGRDDRNAALSFAMLAFFNAAVTFSMMQRMLVTPWVYPG